MSDITTKFDKNLEEFQDAVRNLSVGISEAGVSWNDGQFVLLQQKIDELAGSSKRVLTCGEECKRDIQKFLRIASEV